MVWQNFLRFCLPIAVVTVTTNCHSDHPPDIAARLGQVFVDFEYVGRQPLSKVFTPGDEPRKRDPSRVSLEPGSRYIFHRRLPNDNVRLATEILPERLTKAGFKVTKHPRVYTDMKDAYIGGPMFSIQFSAEERVCHLYNALDSVIARSDELGRQWSPDYYVLEIPK